MTSTCSGAGKMEEEPDGAEEAAHALVAQPLAFEVRGGLPTVHTSASVEGAALAAVHV